VTEGPFRCTFDIADPRRHQPLVPWTDGSCRFPAEPLDACYSITGDGARGLALASPSITVSGRPHPDTALRALEVTPLDLVCFSHLRWDFVFQRPNHLLSRAARTYRTTFIEEPVWGASEPYLESNRRDGVRIITPHLVAPDPGRTPALLRRLVDGYLLREGVDRPVLWYYTPMALPWTRHLIPDASAVIFDCMDDLAGFAGSPPEMRSLEAELIDASDAVFTGGRSLYEARRDRHPVVLCLPSSVDTEHFRQARADGPEPEDQRPIARPRIGYFGVLDERIDWDIVRAVAEDRPAWQLVLVGPTAKVDPAALPSGQNVHYLGPKSYDDLPAYLRGWDVAMMPFARNDATRFISPTKTPEYLAGGRPVAATSIRDVVDPYGVAGLVHIGDGPEGFIAAITAALEDPLGDLHGRADAFLSLRSWDATWDEMDRVVRRAVARRTARRAVAAPGRVATLELEGTNR